MNLGRASLSAITVGPPIPITQLPSAQPAQSAPVAATTDARLTASTTRLTAAMQVAEAQRTPAPNPNVSIATRSGNYRALDGTIIYRNVGNLIPAGWLYVGTERPQESAVERVEDEIIKVEEEVVKFLFSEQVGKAVLILGSVGVIYVSYLWVMHPQQLKAYLNRFAELKSLFVDMSQLMAAIAVIVGLGFIGYEFSVSYERKGSVVAAIADMTARTFETFVSVIVDVIGDLLSDLWGWLKQELKDIFTFNISV